jgi:hypothetical protein
MVDTLKRELAAIGSAKMTTLATIATVIAAGPGPTYSNSGDAGGETVGWTEYIAMLNEQVDKFTDLELRITQALQDLQPFHIVQRVGCGSLIGGRRRY